MTTKEDVYIFRCGECGNMEAAEVDGHVTCTGGDNPHRKHPRKLMNVVDEGELIDEVFGGDEVAFNAHFGFTEGDENEDEDEDED